jgi:catechol 2,3-dioxygenase-like lactoylglutathione lyase family enzyme
MKPRIDVITLAVADFDRALAFYRALGLESSGVIATEHRGDDTTQLGLPTSASACPISAARRAPFDVISR